MRNLYFSVITILSCFVFLYGQTSDNPWAISLGANLVSVQDDAVNSKIGFGVPAVSLSRYITGGFSIGAQYSLNSLEVDNADLDYAAIEAILKYNLSEGNFFPYLFAGYGLSNFEKDTAADGIFPSAGSGRTYLGGVGLNFSISDNVLLNASTSFRSSDEKGSFNHLQHVVGFSYVFGAGDTDKDGVSDKKDECPEVPGLKEFNGCPDTDGDGIPDNKDSCPEEAGSQDLNGCPDGDGDGIADKDDVCPNAAGPLEMNGCPDSDDDGVADNIDKCPQEAGDAGNDGCPWADRDGDGVADKDDTCPDEAGTVANNGCPEVPQKLVDFLTGENARLLFVVNSAAISEDSKVKLSELAKLMSDYPKASIVIEGHASSDGSVGYNQKLSEKRAESVKNALVEMGVGADKLDTVGYGETKPSQDNNSIAGRAANRRVEFDRKVEIKVAE